MKKKFDLNPSLLVQKNKCVLIKLLQDQLQYWSTPLGREYEKQSYRKLQ